MYCTACKTHHRPELITDPWGEGGLWWLEWSLSDKEKKRHSISTSWTLGTEYSFQHPTSLHRRQTYHFISKLLRFAKNQMLTGRAIWLVRKIWWTMALRSILATLHLHPSDTRQLGDWFPDLRKTRLHCTYISQSHSRTLKMTRIKYYTSSKAKSLPRSVVWQQWYLMPMQKKKKLNKQTIIEHIKADLSFETEKGPSTIGRDPMPLNSFIIIFRFSLFLVFLVFFASALQPWRPVVFQTHKHNGRCQQ